MFLFIIYCYVIQNKGINGRVALWSLKLAEYEYQIKLRNGKMHAVPKCVSCLRHRCVISWGEEVELHTLLLSMAGQNYYFRIQSWD